MIKIDRSRMQPPKKFFNIQAGKELHSASTFHQEGNYKRESFDFKAYLDPELHENLVDLFHGKCAFCESPLSLIGKLETEQFRPKHMAINLDGEVSKPGYWWLASELANLYPICPACNRSKGNRFPVSGARASYVLPGTTLSTFSIPASGQKSADPNLQPVIAITYANPKHQLFALQEDGTILAFNLSGQGWMRNNHQLKQTDERYTALSCDAGGDTLFAGTQSGRIIIWQAANPHSTLSAHPHNQPVTALQASPDGKIAAVGFADGMLWIWDQENVYQEMLLPGHKGPLHAVAVTANGKRVISAGSDGQIKVWDLESTPRILFERFHDAPLAGLVLTQDEKKAVSLGNDGMIKVWDTVDWGVLYYFLNMGRPDGFQSLALSGDGQFAASLSGNRLCLFDLYQRIETTPTGISEKETRKVLITKDSRSIIRLDRDNFLEVHSLNNLVEERSLLLDPCQEDPEKFLIFQEDGTLVSVPPAASPAQSSKENAEPGLDRGQITIDIFGLNRSELVYERQNLAKLIKVEMESNLEAYHGQLDHEKVQTWLKDQLGDHQPFAALRRQILGGMIEEVMKREQFTEFLSNAPNFESVVSQSAVQKNIFETNKDLYTEQFQKRASFTVEPTGKEDATQDLFFMITGLIDEIHVVNYRPITELRFKFGSGSADRVGWKVLLGENAVGKSSLLEAVTFALMGPKRFKELAAHENLDPRTLLRRGAKPKEGFVRIYFSGDLQPVEMKITPEGVEYSDPEARLRCYLLGFGPARWLPRPGSQDPETDKFVRIHNLFNPFVPLTDAIKWLAELQKQISTKEYDRVEAVLARLLLKAPGTRFPKYKSSIYIVPPGGRVSNRCDRLDELSDGYQTILAIAAAAMQMLGERWRYEMEAAEGLVLLDEIGEHLHPTWKLRIVESLRSAFPRMQFLGTTHEPLCLRGLYDNEILIMRRVGDRIIPYDNLPSPNTLSIDQLLTSPYFGMLNTFDHTTEADFRRYYEILAKPEAIRSAEEKAELDILHKKLNPDSLIGATYREQVAIQAVDQLLAEKQSMGQTFDPQTLKEETKNLIASLWDELDTPAEG